MSEAELQRKIQDLENRIRFENDALSSGLIAVRYSTNAGQTISQTGKTIVNYEDKIYDDLGLVTIGAAWLMFVPVTGLYRATAMNVFAATTAWATGEASGMYLFKSGAEYTMLDFFDGALAKGENMLAKLKGSDDVIAERGETLQIQLNNLSGGDRTLDSAANMNHVAIHLIRSL